MFISSFKSPRNRMKERPMHASHSEFCLVFCIPSNDGRECVATAFKISSFSGLRSSLLRPVSQGIWHSRKYGIPVQFFLGKIRFPMTPDRDVRAGMDLYRRYAGFSPASKRSVMLSQSKHWSGGRRVCRTCSAAPVVRYMH